MAAQRTLDRVKAIRPDEWIALLVFVLAVVASTWTWFDLARSAHFPVAIAAVPSISLDLGGLYYARNWISGHTRTLRLWGRVTTIAAFVVSMGGNAVQHAIEAGFLTVNLWIVLAVGAVPVLALFGIAHQWALINGRTGRSTKAKGKTEPAVSQGPLRKAASGPAVQGKSDPAPSRTVASVVALGKSPRRDGSRRDRVKAYMRAHPEQRPADVVRGLAAQHVEVPIKEVCKVRDILRTEAAERDADREEVRA